jgi:hypothetical protein
LELKILEIQRIVFKIEQAIGSIKKKKKNRAKGFFEIKNFTTLVTTLLLSTPVRAMPLAQVLPCPQLIFPSKTWFLGIYLNFQW